MLEHFLLHRRWSHHSSAYSIACRRVRYSEIYIFTFTFLKDYHPVCKINNFIFFSLDGS